MKLILDNGKEIELSQEIADSITKEINKCENVRMHSKLEDDTHYYIGSNCDVKFCGNSPVDNDVYSASAFTNEEYAKKVAFKQLVERKLLKFKDEFDDGKVDYDDDVEKWYIDFDYDKKNLEFDYDYGFLRQGIIYFSSKEIAQKAIDTFKDDLIKYFQLNL